MLKLLSLLPSKTVIVYSVRLFIGWYIGLFFEMLDCVKIAIMCANAIAVMMETAAAV